MKASRRAALLILCLAATPCLAAAAGDLPTTTVRLVVGFAPGGGTDGAARIVAEALAPELGLAVVVENRAGAGGTIGAQSVARALPDGHTLFFGTSAELLINPITRKSAPYELLRDFVPIVEIGGVTFVLVVPASSPVDSLAGLIAHAKARTHKLTFSSFGVGSTNHLIGELFQSATGIKAVHVPYKGSQPAMMALLGGEVDFSFETVAVALPQLKAGKLKALATPSLQRLKELPDVTTLQEVGFKDLAAEGWMGVFAPARTPKPIVERVNQALVKVLQTPGVRIKLTERGVKVTGGTPDTFRAKLAAEQEKWRRVVTEAGVSLAE